MPMSFFNFKEDRKEHVDILVFCQRCGKSKASRRKGSLTSWIFQDSRCTCDLEEAPVSTCAQNDVETAFPPNPMGIEEDEHPTSKSFNLGLDDRFEVLSLLGQGGMGSVYKVLDKELGKDFAIKMLHPGLAQDKAASKRFQLEAQMASALTHPNLITVYRDGIAPSGAPYIVMDYVEGVTLAESLKDCKPMHSMRVVDLFLQISEAIAHAHMKGVIHRDIKPSNILVSQSENNIEIARVADFGIGKVRFGESEGLTQTGEVFGSPTYMSPEQGEGEKLDGRSDIYSLGCVMYEALTGRPPFTAANPVKIIMKHLTEPPALFSDDLQIPNSLERVVFHCLEKDPALRYQTVQDLIKDLERIRDGNDAIAHAPSHTLVIATQEASESEKPLQIHPSVYLWEKYAAIEVIVMYLIVIFLPKYLSLELTLIASAILLLLIAVIYNQKEQLRTASRLISSAPIIKEIEGALSWTFDWRLSWLVEFHRFMVPTIEIQDPSSRKQKKVTLSVMFERKDKEVLKALADGKTKKLRMVVDPETGKPVALLINNFFSLLLDERSPIFLGCRPLSICLRRIAAAIADGVILASPFALLLLFASQISALVPFPTSKEELTHIAVFLMSITFMDVVSPFVAPYAYLAVTAGGGGPFVGESTVQGLLPLMILTIAAANFVYHVVFETSPLKATPGKHLFRLHVTARSGRQASAVRSFGVAAIRHAVKIGVFAIVCSFCGIFIFSDGFVHNYPSNLISEIAMQRFPATLLMSAAVIFFSSFLNGKLQSLHDLSSVTRVSSTGKAGWQTLIACVSIIALVLSYPTAVRNSYKSVMSELSQMTAEQLTEKLAPSIKEDPNNVLALQARASIYFGVSRFEEAARDYERLLSLEPNNYDFMRKLSWSYICGNRFDDGINLLEKAIRLKPNESGAYYERALANLIRGETRQALDDFEKTFQLKGGGDDCIAFAALAYKVQGQPVDASKLLSTVAEKNTKQEKPSLLLSYLEGQITAKQLLERDSLDRNYAFFRGIELALEGKRTEAIKLLNETKQQTAATPFNTPFYQVGTAILSRMNAEDK